MPADYVACRDSLIKKGVSEKTAKRRCAIWFYKKHGVSVNEAHKKGEGAFPDEPKLDEDDWETMKLMTARLEDIEERTEASAPDNMSFGNSEVLMIEAANMDFLDEWNVVEIVSTKVGALAFTATGQAVTWTEKALKKAAKTWKYGNVSVNHNGKTYGKIVDSFFDNGVLRQIVKVDDQLKGWLQSFGKLVGVSIEATSVKLTKKMDISDAKGTGVTFIFPPDSPACKIEEGCGIVGKEVEAVKHTPPESGTLPEEGKKIMDRVYNECRKKYSSESAEDKTRCSRIAWYAVKKAGFTKEGDKWVKSSEPSEINLDIEVLDKECGCEDETVLEGTVSTTASNPWYDSTLTTVGNAVNVAYTLDNNIEGLHNNEPVEEAQKDAALPKDLKPEVDAMVENKVEVKTETKPEEVKAEEPKTVCAKKYESDMKKKDEEISAVRKDLESAKAELQKYEEARKAALLDILKAEGLDVEAYKSEPIPVIEKVIGGVTAFKKKLETATEVNSGAEIKASEQKTEPSGQALTKEVEKVTKDEILERAWAKAKEYGIERPKE